MFTVRLDAPYGSTALRETGPSEIRGWLPLASVQCLHWSMLRRQRNWGPLPDYGKSRFLCWMNPLRKSCLPDGALRSGQTVQPGE